VIRATPARLKLKHGDLRFSGTIPVNKPYLSKPPQNLSETFEMNILPVDRALSIYGAIANRSETKGARERLSRHLMKMVIEGETDQHRLTVHGLSYLRDLDREIDSRS
jgi:hypothetical protein